ncbi:hypothetical protein ACFO1B_14825 [Dactylosporangium siamense]|uniref:Uncharacterized protein n=1 Tax=Dactylosporangium siamense TaxID=685454 RepID=A0A919PHV1_9ACTN|nr:hypothetical protein [Dactylosporangium siamense]GIG45106.1 hypothetical protein Dsi01nite_031470 [Dactylosporangium siamense]
MNAFVAVMGPLVALIGVWLGSWLTLRNERQKAQAEQRHREREELRRAYSRYLTACRQFVDYLKQPANPVDVIRSPDGRLVVPKLSGDGAALRQAVEAASADLLMVTSSPDVAEQARELRVAVLRFAIDRANSPDGIVPDLSFRTFQPSEQAFLNAARRDLGMAAIDVALWSTPPELARQQREEHARGRDS